MENITPAPSATSPRSILLRWIDEAFRLEEENRELRALMTALLIAIVRNRPLIEMARGEIEERFPVEVAA